MHTVKEILPAAFWKRAAPLYHFFLALLGALIYRFPSREIYVVGVTGTKGKTTTIELVSAILEEAGYTTALSSTLRVKIAGRSKRNFLKMTMPGRFFIQKFLRQAVRGGAEYAIVEMTSEGVKQFRHKFIALDALIFTNLSPEHIESHGSYAAYRGAKLEIAAALAASPKRGKIVVANADDAEATRFLATHVPIKKSFRRQNAEPISETKSGAQITYHGLKIPTHLFGMFNVYNMLAAATFAESQHIPPHTIATALTAYPGTRGRMEEVSAPELRLPFSVIVDYAHTADSLRQVYEAIPGGKICVLGGTGGGRDAGKRAPMGALAAAHCRRIILTDEDPYDEDPEKIIADIAAGMPRGSYEISRDRRVAIRKALQHASLRDTVIITGKGTDPFIMGPRGTKIPWDDADVAREEMRLLFGKPVALARQ